MNILYVKVVFCVFLCRIYGYYRTNRSEKMEYSCTVSLQIFIGNLSILQIPVHFAEIRMCNVCIAVSKLLQSGSMTRKIAYLANQIKLITQQ